MTNKKRIQLIIAIFELQLPCYHAARMLQIPYTNAKVINRTYKMDKRLLTNQPGSLSQMNGFGSEGDQFKMPELRKETFELLMDSIVKGLFSERVVNKLKISNSRVLLKMIDQSLNEDKFEQAFPLKMSKYGKITHCLPRPDQS